MNKEQWMVTEFHDNFDIQVNEKPTLDIDQNVPELRANLIKEELDEFYLAMKSGGDIVSIADALGDLLYVVYGAAVTYGIDMEPIFAEIHRSNMSKVGGHKRENGKWIKPVTYSPPNLRPIIEAQL